MHQILKGVYNFRCRDCGPVMRKGEEKTYFLLLSKPPVTYNYACCNNCDPNIETISDFNDSVKMQSSSIIRTSAVNPVDREKCSRSDDGSNICNQSSLSSHGKCHEHRNVSHLARHSSMSSGNGSNNGVTPHGTMNRRKRHVSTSGSPHTSSRRLCAMSLPDDKDNDEEYGKPELPAIHYANVRMQTATTGSAHCENKTHQNIVTNVICETSDVNGLPRSPIIKSQPAMLRTGASFSFVPYAPSHATNIWGGSGQLNISFDSSTNMATSVDTPLKNAPTSNHEKVASHNLSIIENDSSCSLHNTPNNDFNEVGSSIYKNVVPMKKYLIPRNHDEICLHINANEDNDVPNKDFLQQGLKDYCHESKKNYNKDLAEHDFVSNDSSTDDLSFCLHNTLGNGETLFTTPDHKMVNVESKAVDNVDSILFSIDYLDSVDADMLVRGTYRKPIDQTISANLYPGIETFCTSEEGKSPCSKTAYMSSMKNNSCKNNSKQSVGVSLHCKSDRFVNSLYEPTTNKRETMEYGKGSLALIANIHGKSMSISHQREEKHCLSPEVKYSSKQLDHDSANKPKSNVECACNQRNGSSLMAKRQSFPLLQYKKQNILSCSSVNTTDDELESANSNIASDQSSIVMFRPIHLRSSKSANIRRLRCKDKNVKFIKQNRWLDKRILKPSRHSTKHLHRLYHPIESRYGSMSSDTLQSTIGCSNTRKFPLLNCKRKSAIATMSQEISNDLETLRSTSITQTRLNGDKTSEDESYNNIRSSLNSKKKRSVFSTSEDLKHLVITGQNRSKHLWKTKQPVEYHRELPLFRQFQVQRHVTHFPSPRYCRSLDYVPNDAEVYVDSSNPNIDSTPDSKNQKQRHSYILPLIFGKDTEFYSSHSDNDSVLSLASSSELCQSDFTVNVCGTTPIAYESEYDNCRTGATSEDDCFAAKRFRDIENRHRCVDLNIDDLTVSDNFSLDVPMYEFTKKVTDV